MAQKWQELPSGFNKQKLDPMIPFSRVIYLKQYVKEILLCLLLGMMIPYMMFVLAKKETNKEVHERVKENITSQEKEADEFQTIIVMDEKNSVRTMDIDDYLTAVVLCEMPASFEKEALKSQAIVARTYALRRKVIGGKHKNADVCTDSNCCQGYCDIEEYINAGGTMDSLEKVKDAVIKTRGLVIVYNEELIDATYFSCSGGMTEDALAVWGSDVPYLQATESPGEEGASCYTETVTLSVTEFAGKLQLELRGSPETWIEDITYTSGGGVDHIRICGKEYRGTDIRKILGLRSTMFTITVIGTTVTITTKGFGHRVGMSQYGADAMATQGKRYDEILTYYYKGTQLVSIETLTH